VDAAASSQFATALLLVAPYARADLELEMTGLGAGGYVELTLEAVRRFGAEVKKQPSGAVKVSSAHHYLARDEEVAYDASAAAHLFALAVATGGQVTVDNAASRDSTVVEVRAPDEIGLLHRITQTLFAEGLDVVSARASTVGSEAVDAFYVRATTGSKLTDPTALSALCRAVVTGLSTPAPPPGDLSEGSPGPPGAHEEPEGS
jgi:5-enolpyruvylshikimate-3-phosphate synthase